MSLTNHLRCPRCQKTLLGKRGSLACSACGARYPVKEGIPVFVNASRLPPHLAKQVAYFEREDERRRTWQLEPWQQRYVKNFLSFGRPKPGGLIIDDATGSGYMALELARRGFRVIATDLTFAELVKLKRTAVGLGLAEKMLLICCDSQNLPIATGVADGLVANAILEHLPDEEGAAREIARVLKKGSPVMLAMPLAYRLLLPILWLPNWLHDRRIGHLRRYTRERILALLPSFHETKTYYTGHLMKVLCLLVYLVTKRDWWNKLGERLDERLETMPYGASNIVSVLTKA